MTNFKSLVESITKQDEKTNRALKSLFDRWDEMARSVDFKEFGKKLSQLLLDRPDEDPRQTRLPFIANTNTTPGAVSPKKRVADITGPSPKCRKVGL
jgi:hypothetical protein